MNGYEDFYTAVMPDLAKHYEISEFDFDTNSHYINVAKTRSHLYSLALVEFYLQEHRQKHHASIINLEGIRSLYHLVFLKTNWKPDEIKKISLEDLLFVLLDDLVPDNLSEPAQKCLANFLKGIRPIKVDLTTYAGWEIGSADQFLKYK